MGGVGLPFPTQWGGGSNVPCLVFWASIQFESTHIKWRNRQMGFANVRSENTVMSNNNMQLLNWKFAYQCGLLVHNYNNKKTGPWATFSGIKVKIHDSCTLVYICLHSASDPSTLVQTRLVTSIHSSKFI